MSVSPYRHRVLLFFLILPDPRLSPACLLPQPASLRIQIVLITLAHRSWWAWPSSGSTSTTPGRVRSTTQKDPFSFTILCIPHYPSFCSVSTRSTIIHLCRCTCVCSFHTCVLVLLVDMKKVHLTSSSMPFLYLFPAVTGAYDMDIPAAAIFRHPRLYMAGINNEYFKVRAFIRFLSYRNTMWWYVMGLDMIE